MNDLNSIFIVQSILWILMFLFLYKLVRKNNKLKKNIDDLLEKTNNIEKED